MRPARLALLALAVGLGAVVEWLFYDASLGPGLTGADLAAGCTLFACGAVAWERRPESRVGPILVLAGSSWFLGNVATPLVYLHRGPLAQLVLSYPSGRVRGRLIRAVVAAAYLDGAIEPLARQDVVTLVLSAAVALVAVRRAAVPGLAAALALAGVLALGAGERLSGVHADRPVLWAYDVVIAAVALLLLADLLRGRWAEAIVTGLVVDLGAQADAGTLRTKLARALADPSLVVGYRLGGSGRLVDDTGAPIEPDAPGPGRTVTPLADAGGEVAVLVHDEALLADARLLEAVAAAARLALANAALQAEARVKEAELGASRRRIVEAGDEQRRRIRERLELGAGSRLERVATLLETARAGLEANEVEAVVGLEQELAAARNELAEFAHGVRPATLTEEGLMPALAQLAERSTLPVDLRGSVARLTAPVEAALFFVCSEAVANAAKHAGAGRVAIELSADQKRVLAAVADDGVGGADPAAGSGLRGLADRVEALGGRLDVVTRAGAGTRVVAEIPLTDGA